MPITNIHVYPSTFIHESRILKETRSLLNHNIVDKIWIIAIWDNGLGEIEKIDKNRDVWRVRLKTGWLGSGNLFKLIKFSEWMLRIFFKFRHKQIDIFNSHSLTVLPLGVLFKLFHGTTLIYDTHELETETCGSKGVRRILAKAVERACIPFVDHMVVVSDSIGQWYTRQYKSLKCTVVKNIPLRRNRAAEPCNHIKEKLDLNNDEMLFIYQGVIADYRGIDILLDVFSQLNQDKHITFMGYGDLENKVRDYAEQYQNIHFLPAVKPREVIEYSAGADVGISLIENACLSYYYSLPNKVFEYLLSGIPFIVSDFPEMGNFVRKHQCGWTVDVESNALKDLIASITFQSIYEKKLRAFECMKDYDWTNEEVKLIQLYEKLLNN